MRRFLLVVLLVLALPTSVSAAKGHGGFSGYGVICPVSVSVGSYATIMGAAPRDGRWTAILWTMPSGRIRGLEPQQTAIWSVQTPESVSEPGTQVIRIFDPQHGPGWGRQVGACSFSAV